MEASSLLIPILTVAPVGILDQLANLDCDPAGILDPHANLDQMAAVESGAAVATAADDLGFQKLSLAILVVLARVPHAALDSAGQIG